MAVGGGGATSAFAVTSSSPSTTLSKAAAALFKVRGGDTGVATAVATAHELEVVDLTKSSDDESNNKAHMSSLSSPSGDELAAHNIRLVRVCV
jgi:hypothetical protein